MFVLILDYKLGLDAVERHLPAHIDWLKQGYADGLLLASGRQVPRTGGVILARGDRAAVEALAARDPFVVHGVATCRLVEFAPTMTVPELASLREDPAQ